MYRKNFALVISLVAIFCITANHSHADDTATPIDWKPLTNVLGDTGFLKDAVYTYRIPRTDLNVTIDGMDVPTGAGLESTFHFYKCPCGHFWVVGQFCCTEYESDDVVDALRSGAMIRIGSVAPMFSGEKPKLTLVHFQGEGDAEQLARLLKSALSWMGDERTRAATRPTK